MHERRTIGKCLVAAAALEVLCSPASVKVVVEGAVSTIASGWTVSALAVVIITSFGGRLGPSVCTTA